MTAVRAWIVVTPNGHVFLASVRTTEDAAWREAGRLVGLTLEHMQAQGYRCTPVTTQEARHDER